MSMAQNKQKKTTATIKPLKQTAKVLKRNGKQFRYNGYL